MQQRSMIGTLPLPLTFYAGKTLNVFTDLLAPTIPEEQIEALQQFKPYISFNDNENQMLKHENISQTNRGTQRTSTLHSELQIRSTISKNRNPYILEKHVPQKQNSMLIISSRQLYIMGKEAIMSLPMTALSRNPHPAMYGNVAH